MSNAITPQFIGNYLSGFTAMASQQTLKESLSSSTITLRLQIHINNLTILIDCSPQVVLFAIHLYKDFIDAEGVAIASMFSFQAPSINGTELVTPEAYRFSGHSDAALGQLVFDVTVAQVESIVEPDCV